MTCVNRRSLMQFVLFTSLVAGQSTASKQVKRPADSESRSSAGAAPLPEIPQAAKVVRYSAKDVVKVKAKLRYTTLIILPKNE